MSRTHALATLLLGLALPSAIAAQEPVAPPEGVVVIEAAKLGWNPLELPGFDPGLNLAVVQGDPSVADQPYTIRLRFPDGYKFPAHFHPNAENLTVLSGTFQLGHGKVRDDAALQTYRPGDYLFIPGGMAHYGGVQGETVIQLHGIGPFDVRLAQPDASND